MEPLKAQRELLEITIELQRLDQRLHELAAGLPRPAEQEPMLEGEIPCDVATEVYGSITFGQSTQLRPLIANLGDASKVTHDDLRARFLQRAHRVKQPPATAATTPVVSPAPERQEADA